MDRGFVPVGYPHPTLEQLEARVLLSATAEQAIELFHTTPAVFVENQGQWADESVRFVHNGQGANIAHTDAGSVFELFRARKGVRNLFSSAPNSTEASPEKVPDPFSSYASPAEMERLRFAATFDGANAVTPVGLDPAETRFNFLLGDPSSWREDVPSYETVAYEGLYDGIDLQTWGRRDHLKYEFHVAPAADFSQISVSYSGIDSLTLDDAGALHVCLPDDWGEVTDAAPYVYQLIDGEQVEVAGAYRLIDADTYAFEITGSYDPARELVIDPELDWSSYLGGSDDDDGRGVATDAAGNALITGLTLSAGWVSGGWDTSLGGSAGDAFVVKLSPSGEHLWSTYLGGGGFDGGSGIAVDASDNVLVAGWTASPGWVSGGWDTTLDSGDVDGFVVKLEASGGHLWSSYVGGDSSEQRAYGIAVDADGNALIAGQTVSSDWVSGGWDTSYNGGGHDAFAVKLSASGGHVWSTFLGGGADDIGHDIAVDADGNVLVTGETHSAGWVSGGWSEDLGGAADGFVVKLSPSGGHVWSTFLGGGGEDGGHGVAADADGNVLVTGWTNSTGWVAGGWDTFWDGWHDAFVVKLGAAGEHLWSTYLGGSASDAGYDIAADGLGNVLVAGRTYSPGWVAAGDDLDYDGNSDGFVAKLTPSGQHLWSTYLGGGDEEVALGIAADPSGNVLVTGWTHSPDWVSGGWDTSWNGWYDAFVARFLTDTIAPTADGWYSAAEHAKGVGEALLAIPDDGTFIEPRMPGVAYVRIEFSEPIAPATFTPGSVGIVGNDAAGVPVDLAAVSIATSTAEGDTVGIIALAPALPDAARYLVRIEGVTDVDGNPMAGDNDRIFTALAGDASGNLRTDAIDLSYIWTLRTAQVDEGSEDQVRADVNCDGRVDAVDLSTMWPERNQNMRGVPDPVIPPAGAAPAVLAAATSDGASAPNYASAVVVEPLMAPAPDDAVSPPQDAAPEEAAVSEASPLAGALQPFTLPAADTAATATVRPDDTETAKAATASPAGTLVDPVADALAVRSLPLPLG